MAKTQTITGTTITGGYVLSTTYVGISVTSTGEIEGVSGSTTSNYGPTIGATGGVALDMPFYASAYNDGVIIGGNGAAGGYADSGLGVGAYGGVGGAGVSFEAGGTMNNLAAVTGGAGGAGGTGGSGNASGGTGGAAVSVVGGGGILNSGALTGGGGGSGAGGNTGIAVIGGPGGLGGRGISLANGASVVNNGTITGGQGGIGGQNFGSGGGRGGRGGAGIYQYGAATIINNGLIQGGVGGAAYAVEGSGPGGVGGFGIYLFAGGNIVNSSTIAGGAGGLAAGGLGNGPAGAGVVVKGGGGTVTNGSPTDASALIQGSVGVSAGHGGAVTINNYGTIKGFNASVDFHPGATDDRLIAQPGSDFIGSIYGGNSTLELPGGTGTITGLGARGTLSGAVSAIFGQFGAYVTGPTADWSLVGANQIGVYRSASLDNQGTLSITGASSLKVAGVLTNSGEMDIGGAAGNPFAGLVFSGTRTLSGSGTVSLNATGYISGLTAGDNLTNLDNTIEGGGFIRGPISLTNDGTIDNNVGRMVLNTGNTAINDGLIESAGTGLLLIRNTTVDSSGGGQVIDASKMQLDGSTLLGGSLRIDKGALLISEFKGGAVNLSGGTVINAGVVDGAGAGGLVIDGDVANNGLLQALNGRLTITGAVSGSGKARMWGAGSLEVDGALTQNVFFAAKSTGTLVLDDPAAFTGRVYGFSHSGANAIDFKSVIANGFSYAGSIEGGVLTLTENGSAVASVRLTGDFLTKSTFTLASDGGTGTLVTDPPKATTLTSAMAGFGAAGGTSTAAGTHTPAPPGPLARPGG